MLQVNHINRKRNGILRLILQRLPIPHAGDRVTFMGNTGEGKTETAIALIRTQPNVVILNTKHDPIFEERNCIDNVITKDNRIFGIRGGRFDFRPTDDWLENPEPKEQFFKWALQAGNRVIYIDEFGDICPNAQRYPFFFQKAVKQGRWKDLGIWGSAQEPIRVPSFAFGQSQYRVLFYLGWQPHRKAAEQWFQQNIDWEQIPERSHKFYLKTPAGFYGPQPKLDLRSLETVA